MKFKFIADHQTVFPVRRMCQVLGVSASGYYAWRRRPVSEREQANLALLRRIQTIHADSQRTYGSPRVHAELVAQGVACNEKRVARLMRLYHLRAKQTKRYRVKTTDSDHDLPVAPNRLNRQFEAEAPNAKWVSDITYIPTREGWLYLATVMDLFSRRIVGWSMAGTLSVSLVERALQMAIDQRRPSAGLLLHSDRGSQYASAECRALLSHYQMVASMSRTGNCYDNAVIESFFGTLKSELVHHQQYQTRDEGRRSVFAYIEAFYNRRRRHSALGYKSPVEFEQSHHGGLF